MKTVNFKQLKDLFGHVDTDDINTFKTTVIKHLLRITADDIHSDILYNAETEQQTANITDERYDFIKRNLYNTCPDLYPQ